MSTPGRSTAVPPAIRKTERRCHRRYVLTWRCKWICDGARSLPEIAARLRAEADEFDRMHAEGVTMREEMADDYAFLVTTNEYEDRKMEERKLLEVRP